MAFSWATQFVAMVATTLRIHYAINHVLRMILLLLQICVPQRYCVRSFTGSRTRFVHLPHLPRDGLARLARAYASHPAMAQDI